MTDITDYLQPFMLTCFLLVGCNGLFQQVNASTIMQMIKPILRTFSQLPGTLLVGFKSQWVCMGWCRHHKISYTFNKYNLIIENLGMCLERYTHAKIPPPCKLNATSHNCHYSGKGKSYIVLSSCLNARHFSLHILKSN